MQRMEELHLAGVSSSSERMVYSGRGTRPATLQKSLFASEAVNGEFLTGIGI